MSKSLYIPRSTRHPAQLGAGKSASRGAECALPSTGLTSSCDPFDRPAGGLRMFNRLLRKRGVAIAIWCVLLVGMALQIPGGNRASRSSKVSKPALTSPARAAAPQLNIGGH